MPAVSMLTEIENLLLVNLDSGNVHQIWEATRHLTESELEKTISLVEASTKDPTILGEEDSRVKLAKVLVALFPIHHSSLVIALDDRSCLLAYELHFSLFCFLDGLTQTPISPDSKRMLLGALSSYLQTIDTEAAQANWMCGDLLGDHWRLDESLPILVSAATDAQHVAGQLGAIHGIQCALQRHVSETSRERIKGVLRCLSRQNGEVRVGAERLLAKFYSGAN